MAIAPTAMRRVGLFTLVASSGACSLGEVGSLTSMTWITGRAESAT